MGSAMRANILLLSLLLVSCRGSELMEPNTNDDGDCALLAEQFAFLMPNDPAVARVHNWYAPARVNGSFGRAAAFRTAFNQEPGHYKFAFEECDDRAEKDRRFGQMTGKKS